MKNSENHYWSSLEELEGSPEFVENVSREFPASAQESSSLEVNRRDFLKFLSVGLMAATAACSRKSVEKIIPYVNKPEEIIPGIATWYASTCHACSASCGIVVKTREGRPIKLEGNSIHPTNQGALCAKGQASILNLYSPGRYEHPLTQSTGSLVSAMSWDQLDKVVREKLNAASQIGLLTGLVGSPATKQLIEDFKSRFTGTVTHAAYDLSVPEEIGLANELSYGQKITPRYRFDQARVLVSFGADFLGNYLSPVEFARQFSKARKVGDKKMSRFVAFEGNLSLSGTNADDYYALKSGDELSVALSLAHEIIVKRKTSALSGDGEVNKFLLNYAPETVAAQVGVSAAVISKLAQELIANKGQSLVLGGALHGKDALALQVVVNLINSALENDGATVDYSLYASRQADSSFADLKHLIEEMNAGRVDVLIIQNTNPVYSLPESMGFLAALKKVPFVVSVAEEANETTAQAHIIAATSHYLESWNDAQPQEGVYSIAQPTINTLYDTRSFQESLLRWAEVSAHWDAYLKDYWQNKIFPKSGANVPFEIFWIDTLQRGVLDLNARKQVDVARLANPRSWNTKSLATVALGTPSPDKLSLALYSSISMGDGSASNNPWLQELPDPLSKVVWDNYLAVSPLLATQKKLSQGDVVRIEGQGFNFDAPILIMPKMNEKSVAIAVGYGHGARDRGWNAFNYLGGDLDVAGSNVGVNVANAQQLGVGGLQWGGIAVSLEKTGKRYELAITQGHHTMENRPIIQDATFEEYLANPAAGIEGHHEDLTMWEKHKYEGYKWGMAIDMTACTGCSSCMIACQVENNVPVVGKEQVIKGRDMHWLRIDRYFKGDVAEPEVAYQPMLCQHCDNAPCETVCPVLATMHNDEGINVMVYNRCVGTRYCANNCPYKVRRFNFFEYTEEMKTPLNMVLNPDVTVREQGIMEKCTFCWQRVREAKDYAKDQERDLRDGEVRTACQQTCPTDAIVFGNLNDASSRVSKLAHSQRGYHVLDFVNTKSNITYLTKIRNKGSA